MNNRLEKKIIENKRRLFAKDIKEIDKAIVIAGFLDIEYSNSWLQKVYSKLNKDNEICTYDSIDVSYMSKVAKKYLIKEISFINGIGESIIMDHKCFNEIGAIKIGTPLYEKSINTIMELLDYNVEGFVTMASIDGEKGICVWCSEYDTIFYKWS